MIEKQNNWKPIHTQNHTVSKAALVKCVWNLTFVKTSLPDGPSHIITSHSPLPSWKTLKYCGNFLSANTISWGKVVEGCLEFEGRIGVGATTVAVHLHFKIKDFKLQYNNVQQLILISVEVVYALGHKTRIATNADIFQEIIYLPMISSLFSVLLHGLAEASAVVEERPLTRYCTCCWYCSPPNFELPQ